MIRSIYTRVVLTFLASVIGGTIIALFVATWVFEDKLKENMRIPLLHFGQDIVKIYETFPLREANSFVSGMKQLDSYYIRIFDEAGKFQSYGLNGHKPVPVTMEEIKKFSQEKFINLITGILLRFS